MTEEFDLLSSVAGKGGERKVEPLKRVKFEASIIATYNAYLPFYEDVVLPRLVASGCQHNVLLLDGRNLLQGLSSTISPRLAGRAYTLVPMRSAGAFHPKIALLVGKKNARLLLGSHNVTLSGFGHNREVTTQIDLPNGEKDPDAPLAQAAWRYLNAWLRHQGDPLPESVLDAALRVATSFAPWLKESPAKSGNPTFVGVEPEGDSLWARVRPALPVKVRRVVVSGPFFDRSGAFLQTLSDDLKPIDLVVGVEPDTVELCSREKLPAGIHLVDVRSLGRGHGYFHAKILWVEGEAGDEALITGSANPSSAAWTEGPTRRNAEAVLIQRGETARAIAESLGITSIPSMPALGDEALREIEERMAETGVDPQPSSSVSMMVAEALEGEILLRWIGLTTEQLKAVHCWGQGGRTRKSPEETRCDAHGLHIMLPPAEIAEVTFIEVETIDGQVRHAFVHHPALIARLSRTSTQQRLREALDSLDSESPDLPTLIRLADNLIFDEEGLQTPGGSRDSSKKRKDEGDQPIGQLGSLSVSIEDTRHDRKRVRDLRGGDLSYIIDILIHRLGLGLRTAAEQFEGPGPSEEEQVGAEEDVTESSIPPQVDLAKTCQSKIRTLVGRMLRQLEMPARDNERGHRPVEQLLAVLAVIREVRAQDKRLSPMTGGQSLVPMDQRKRLLDGALIALFGEKRGLFELASRVFEDDPDKDLSRLLGLLLWLAWDTGLDSRTIDLLKAKDIDQRRESLLDLARLVEIAIAVGEDEEVFSETEHSIWRTVVESASGIASSWIAYHRVWSHALADLKHSNDAWKLHSEHWPGALGIAVAEPRKRIRVVLGLNWGNVVLAELGKGRGDSKLPREKQDQVEFLPGFVAVTELPKIAM